MLQAEYARLYRTCLQNSQLVNDRILNRSAIAELVDEHTSKRADHGNRLWLLINAEIWYRMSMLGQSKEDLRRELTAGEQSTRRAG